MRSKAGSNLAKKKYLSGDTKVVADFAKQFTNATKKLNADQIATLGKWEMTVPLATIIGSLGAGAAAGSMYGAPTAGALMTAIPAAIGTVSPRLGTAGLLQRTPNYGSRGAQTMFGVTGLSPYMNKENQ